MQLVKLLLLLVFVSTTNTVSSFSTPISPTAIPKNHSMKSSIVTGASGYLGREIVHQLLSEQKEQNQYDDRIYCLVRSSRLEEEERYWEKYDDMNSVNILPYDMLDEGETVWDALQKCISDRNDDEDDARCSVRVFHVASIFSPTENHIQMAHNNVHGTEKVMYMAKRFKEEQQTNKKYDIRVLVTSSMAAVRASSQIPANGKYYTHDDWNTVSKLEDDSWGSSYQWSKAQSERRAWEISKFNDNDADKNDSIIPLTTLCPPFIFGPPSSLHNNGNNDIDDTAKSISSNSYSIGMVQSWIAGKSQVQSRLCVDVRDIAKAHIIASNEKNTIGKRYIVSTEARISSQKMAEAIINSFEGSDLQNHIKNKITCDTTFKGGVIPIGEKEVECSQRCKDELNGLTCRPVEETMIDMAKVLFDIPVITK